MIHFMLSITLVVIIGIIGVILLSESNVDEDEFE